MSIDRKQISEKFSQLILNEYRGRHKELLLYLTPIIFENNPAQNCRYKCNEKIREMVPDRRKMDPNSDYGMAIGNLTAQAASNLNLNDFDNYVIKVLKFDRYIRYVDDIVIIASDREKLINSISKIENKLKESHQILNYKKTIADTAYHGVKFLGKISYPYGYQKASKQVRTRVINKAQNVKFDSDEILLAKVNSQIGVLKNYNCRKLILNYAEKLPIEAQKIVVFNNEKNKFEKA